MDSMEKPKPVKQLREVLEEQQEPFILDIYLVERGFLKKNLNSESSFSHCHGNSKKSLMRSVSCYLNSSKKGVTHRCKILRTIYKQVISINERLRLNSCHHREGKFNVANQQIAEEERFSSASSTTMFNSCSKGDVEETRTSLQTDHISFTTNASKSLRLRNQKGIKAITERRLQWRCMDDNKQLSPVSVLQEIPSKAGSPVYHSFTEIQQLVQSSLSSQYPTPKMVLQHTEQLLFDCVREVVETQGRKEKQQEHHTEYLRSEEHGRLIGEKIKLWEKQSGEESKLIKLLDLDLLDSAKEWRDYETQRRDIGLQIGDTVEEELKNEICMDIIDFLSPTTKC